MGPLERTTPSAETAATPPPAGGELKVSILTFEPDTSLDAASIRKQLADEGINWHWLPYHKRFSAIATAWDIFRGTMFIRSFIAHEKPDILHGRVHVPTLMGALARKLSWHKPRLIFDIRGFFPEEYTDAGVWPEGGLMYRIAKRVERWLMKESDGFVVLTEKAREILFPESRRDGFDKLGRPVEVIPCCVDLDKFRLVDAEARNALRKDLVFEERYVVTHVGALGGLYLTKEIADLVAVVREFDSATFALFLTQSNSQLIEPLLQERGFGPHDYFIGRVDSSEVARYLNASDVALSFVKAGFSTASRSPTKIAEYLACGLPIIANPGVGDVEELITKNRVGAIVTDFSSNGYLNALRTVEANRDFSQHCREVAMTEFDLESVGGRRYQNLYRRLLETRDASSRG